MKQSLLRMAAVAALVACSSGHAAFKPGPDGLPEGWKLFRIDEKVAATRFSLLAPPEQAVLHARADNSMAGIIRKQRIDLDKTPILCWRWKVKTTIAKADLRTKAGDDYAARIYVFYDVPASQLGFSDRLKIKLAKSLYGAEIPTAALNYVWDNQYSIGTLRANAYTDRTRMLVVESGNAKAGQWLSEARDVRQDYLAAFGGQAPDVVGLAIATDTDNTHGDAEAWYQEPRFVARAEQCPAP
ncbi:MAG: DUF3047 domain-containing protein [Pseudomonadota bacterium]